MQSAQALRGSNLFLLFLGGLIALTPLSIDAYLPAMPAMANYFSVNIVAVNLTMTFYLLGGALGQFSEAPCQITWVGAG
jgi:DHA1 family bicyclomycin/chloramphenicol resistance-like MFS transporter